MLSEDENFFDGIQAHNYDLFFTNKRILLIEDFASKNAGLLGIFGGVIGYGIAKAITDGKRTSHEEMLKNYKGKFDAEISLSDLKKIEMGKSGRYFYFKIISKSDKMWFFYKGKTNFEDRLRRIHPDICESKDNP